MVGAGTGVLAFCSGDALAASAGFLLGALDGVAVLDGAAALAAGVVWVELLGWFCAIPSAAANRVSAMVFMIPLFLFARFPSAPVSKRGRGNHFLHAIHDGAARR